MPLRAVRCRYVPLRAVTCHRIGGGSHRVSRQPRRRRPLPSLWSQASRAPPVSRAAPPRRAFGPRGLQPAARGPRSSGGLARLHHGRGEAGVSAKCGTTNRDVTRRPCEGQPRLSRRTRRHTPSLTDADRHTSSHFVAHRHTPSHTVTRRHTPSHAVTRRHTPSHTVTHRCIYHCFLSFLAITVT